MVRCVYEDRYVQVVVPEVPLNSREDGGHLVVVKKIPVTDRSDLTYQESIAFMRISMLVGKAMYDVLRHRENELRRLGKLGTRRAGWRENASPPVWKVA
jgi:diadenosine tetraphosphate (Ap4A) HIT family hydrolase